MNGFLKEGDKCEKPAPIDLCIGLLRVISAGGEDLKVMLVSGWRITGDPTFRWPILSNADVVAVWFGAAETEGLINRNAGLASAKALEAEKRFAIIGVRRGKLSPEVQAACAWVIY